MLIEHMGPAYTFRIYAALTVACCVFSYYLVPEPRESILEQVNDWQRFQFVRAGKWR